ncbi:MAG: M20/M25/M40 family metallo-hydrolase [Ruminococcus sp.]|nr:M20/M25/M40 family metallo-hydrolase [Ruminococcus sp.]
MDLFTDIKELAEAWGPSGCEGPAGDLAMFMLESYCSEVHASGNNVIGRFGTHQKGKPHLVLDAHIDQIGMIVTGISDDGFVKVDSLGGIDRRLLPTQQVLIYGERQIPGVFSTLPPHLAQGGNKVMTFAEAAIDTGLPKEELEELVSPGDCVKFDVKLKRLLGERVTCGALDDRCGVACILYALELLKGCELRYNVTVIFSCQEEVGERGAKIGAFELSPDIAIAVDVSFAMNTGEDPKKCGELGKGPMIGISPSLSRRVSDKLIACAKAAQIPFQYEVMNGTTGTNADRYSVERGGAETGTVSIPLRNMHTPAEVIDIEDVRLSARLLAEFIKEEQK